MSQQQRPHLACLRPQALSPAPRAREHGEKRKARKINAEPSQLYMEAEADSPGRRMGEELRVGGNRAQGAWPSWRRASGQCHAARWLEFKAMCRMLLYSFTFHLFILLGDVWVLVMVYT